ncbi:SLAM family member 8 [Hemicordylus capensis]|uniref:SLAM family member 8 n=1 Tax=Hemicordylus capensis TaxID=884348 RepID=UPI002302D524|nr:SLAM family member 8 [Hemicordylus capensis]
MGRILLTGLLHAASLLSLAHTSGQVLGRAGDPVFLKPSLAPGVHVRDAIWRSHSPAEELVAVSFKGTLETQYESRFSGRTRLHPNLTLELRPVGLEDSGEVSVLLVDTTGRTELQTFHLLVYDAVSTPRIRVFSEESNQNSSAGSCLLFLTCTTSSGNNVTYSWLNSEGKALAGDTHSVFENGQVLWARLGLTEDSRGTYTCTVANAVSRKSVTVSIWDHCRKQSDAKDSAFDYRNILLIVVPLISILLSAAAIMIMRSKRRSGRKLSYDVAANEPVPV